jgi:hypothetical protein
MVDREIFDTPFEAMGALGGLAAGMRTVLLD